MRLQMDFVPHCVAYRFNWYWHSFACFFFAVRVTASKRFQNLYLAWETWRFLAAHMVVYSSLLQIIFRDFLQSTLDLTESFFLVSYLVRHLNYNVLFYCRPSLEIRQSFFYRFVRSVNLESNFWNNQFFQKANDRLEKTILRALRKFFSRVCSFFRKNWKLHFFLKLLTFIY